MGRPVQFFQERSRVAGWSVSGGEVPRELSGEVAIINSASAKSCELDPIPTTLLYENLDTLLPTITNIINTSLTTGIVQATI